MNFITIDTVLDKSYIGLFKDGKEITKIIESDEINFHSAYLIQTLKETLDNNNISVNEIDYIGVNTGVGSFTGIRAGLSVVKVMASRLNIKCVPYTTIEVLSNAFNNKNIILDARRNSVFYSNDGIKTELMPYENAFDILKNDIKFISEEVLIRNEKFADFKDKLVSYEINCPDLAFYEIQIVKEKINSKEFIDSNLLKAAYIQTPPVFIKS